MCVAFFRCLWPKPPHFENAFHKAPCFPQYNRLQPARLTIFTVVPGVALQQLCTSVICVVSGRAFSFTFPEERLVSRTLTSFDVTSVCNMLVSLLAGGKRAIEVNEPLIDSTCHQSFSFDFIEKEPWFLRLKRAVRAPGCFLTLQVHGLVGTAFLLRSVAVLHSLHLPISWFGNLERCYFTPSSFEDSSTFTDLDPLEEEIPQRWGPQGRQSHKNHQWNQTSIRKKNCFWLKELKRGFRYV